MLVTQFYFLILVVIQRVKAPRTKHVVLILWTSIPFLVCAVFVLMAICDCLTVTALQCSKSHLSQMSNF